MAENKDILDSLYPFAGEGGPRRDISAAIAEASRAKADDHLATVGAFFAEQNDRVARAAEIIAASYRAGGRLLAMGNGGSSCDAAHLAVEFLHPVTAGRPALPAVNLTADTAMLTAVGNDVGFGHVFLRQVIANGRKGDCLVGFSTSGTSDNLLAAFEKARDMGLSTIGFAGKDGGAMARSDALDVCLTIGSDSIHRIQETHLLIYHILWDLVHTLLADDRWVPEIDETIPPPGDAR
ncbi:MAG: phosphoheptose isomerase [Roseovarius sp.]|nr:phosphoheptose isomerase [Roseovarius sp.]MBK45053.1 phosphoheptose isomerase [Roseovarius sp.]|tara:strand:- start:1631 stop:2341 length:711 start_codon:yes stop_codon:yes gene_type:complete